MTTTPASADPYAKVIAQAWSDETYKQRLTDDPRSVLAEAGIETPNDVEVRTVENTANVVHLVIPVAPSEGEISEEALGQVSGGTYFCSGSISTLGCI